MASDDDEKWLKALNALAEPPSTGESVARGGLQGVTSGWGDEIAAGIDTAASKIPGLRSFAQSLHDPKLPPIDNPDVPYAQRRDAYRAANQAAHEQNPKAYLGGEFGGSMAQSLLPGTSIAGGAKGVAQMAGQGAVAGAGFSDADTAGGLTTDALKGAGVGIGTGLMSRKLAGYGADAADRAAVNMRRDLAGPHIGNEAGARSARQEVYELGPELNQQVKSDPELGRAIKDKNPRLTQAIAQQRSLKLNDDNMANYAHATAKSREGGVPMSDMTDPLDGLAARLRKQGKSGMAAEVDKINTQNVRTDMFGQGTVADPRDVRAFISKLQEESGHNLTLPEKEAVAARGEAARALLGSLDGWVERSAGPEVAAKVRANNKAISTLMTVQKAAVEGGKTMEMAGAKAPAGGVMGMVKQTASNVARPWEDFAADPTGQALIKGAAAATKALPAPLIDAMTAKDDEAAKKAIAADIFGGAP